MRPVADRTSGLRAGDILCIAVVRDEAARLPHWLDHARAQGVARFLMVDNASTDGTREMLADQPDVALWTTDAGYAAARFGLDWASWLLMRYGHGHWCLTLDADELLTYPQADRVDLHGLTDELDARGQVALGCTMLDLLPEGRLGDGAFGPGDDPLDLLRWFDPGPFRAERQAPRQNLWLQGGTRDRVFFAETPARAPTLNKLPLIRWHRRYAYTNATHAALPPRLNLAYDGPDDRTHLTGALLHTKFLPGVLRRAEVERARRQHFARPEQYEDYYAHLLTRPVLRGEASLVYTGWRQLQDLGLIHAAGWEP